jgi:predicted ATPase
METNLPVSLTVFVGRERELRELGRLLLQTRLVTLTGPGGCGKTRLAVEAARDLMEREADGTWFVDLST